MATAHTNLSAFDPNEVPSGKGLKIGVVVAEWNKQITENLYLGAEEALVACGVEKSDIDRTDVPGSFELVFGAKLALEKGVDAVIVIGSVIQGKPSILILFARGDPRNRWTQFAFFFPRDFLCLDW